MLDAEPAEVEALLHNLCGDLLAEPDPLIRYTALTTQQALVDGVVSALKRERGKALGELNCYHSLEAVAELVGLGSRQRVQQLIAAAQTTPEVHP